MEDRLNELPKGWVWTTVGEISQNIHYGYTESSSENQVGPKFLRITDIQNNSVNWVSVPYCRIDDSEKGKYLLKDGDLVFARTGATVGKSFLIRGNVPEAVFASYLIRIILDKRIHTVFISNFFQSIYYWSQIHKGKIGIGQPNVNAQILSRISIPLAPLPEQHRIVARIEELLTRLDAGTEALKKIKAQLKRYRQAVLKYAFEGKFTQEWREANKGKIEPACVLLERIKEERKKDAKGKYKELPPIDTSDLPDLPEGWSWVKIQDITSDALIGIVKSALGQNKLGVGVPYIKMDKITMDGKVLLEDLVYVEVSDDDIERYRIKEGDILFNTRNSLELVGKTGLVKGTIKKTIYNNNLMRIRMADGVSPAFTVNQMCSDHFRKRMERVKRATTNVAAIYAKDLMPLNFMLPSSLEQLKIVEEIESRLSVADDMEKVADQSLKQSERLRQSILKRAFEGKLVPQDPTDEPAEKLLDRIKEEKIKREGENRSEKKHRNKKSKQMELI